MMRAVQTPPASRGPIGRSGLPPAPAASDGGDSPARGRLSTTVPGFRTADAFSGRVVRFACLRCPWVFVASKRFSPRVNARLIAAHRCAS